MATFARAVLKLRVRESVLWNEVVAASENQNLALQNSHLGGGGDPRSGVSACG